ncbi:MAG: hypothetical protein ACJ8R9_11015 [Steroidobacteraceae bacterium]
MKSHFEVLDGLRGTAALSVLLFAHWIWKTHPSAAPLWLVSAALYVGVVFVAWLLLKHYDEPIRKYLTRRLTAASTESASIPVYGS